ncbi:MAG: hypothetical protein LBO68_04530 [Synergistaceae bacterium]|nr:hypothetical protein [Synergistaceae bacterium]
MKGAVSAPLFRKRGTARGGLLALCRVLLLSHVLLLATRFPSEGATGKTNVLRFGELYSGVSSLGITLSDKLKSLDGGTVEMKGFMAPPLKPTLDFFVLTRVPMSICPFCSSDADWPIDIVVVYVEKSVRALPFDRPIRVEGRLEVGTKIDAETGFVSLVRIYADRIEEAN